MDDETHLEQLRNFQRKVAEGARTMLIGPMIFAHCPTIVNITEEEVNPIHHIWRVTVKPCARTNRTIRYLRRYVDKYRPVGNRIDIEVTHAN